MECNFLYLNEWFKHKNKKIKIKQNRLGMYAIFLFNWFVFQLIFIVLSLSTWQSDDSVSHGTIFYLNHVAIQIFYNKLKLAIKTQIAYKYIGGQKILCITDSVTP